MKSVGPITLKKWLAALTDIILVDVRELAEHEHFNIGGNCIPYHEITKHSGEFIFHKTYVFYCKKGIRSRIAIQRLQQLTDYPYLVNLDGGLDKWQRDTGGNL